MAVWSAAEALAQARQLLDLPLSDKGSVWLVWRLDREEPYYLVHMAGHVACLDCASGALLASAATTRAPVTVTREAALERAGLGDAPTIELVWKPCAASMSMFDPLWSVALGGQRVYVDQRSKVWRSLPSKERGGTAR